MFGSNNKQPLEIIVTRDKENLPGFVLQLSFVRRVRSPCIKLTEPDMPLCFFQGSHAQIHFHAWKGPGRKEKQEMSWKNPGNCWEYISP